MINPSDAMTIQAFTAILPQLDATLPKALKQEVNRVGEQICDRQPEAAAEQIRELVEHNDCLKQPYDITYDRIWDQYQTQERSKALDQTQEQSEALAAPVTSSLESKSSPLNLDDITLPILTASDFLSAAKAMLKQIEHRLQRAPEEVRVYALSLQVSVVKADEQAIALLNKLDKRFRTPEDLATEANLPLEQTEAMVNSLWKQGYIEPVAGRMVYKIFPMLRTRHSSEAIDSHTYFTLTAKGHFFLHPVVSLNGQSRSML